MLVFQLTLVLGYIIPLQTICTTVYRALEIPSLSSLSSLLSALCSLLSALCSLLSALLSALCGQAHQLSVRQLLTNIADQDDCICIFSW